MLETLSISNYALIDHIELDFQAGFNIITGETGAGKSIMLGAMSMLFGNRADSRVVTDKTKKSVVEARFNISHYGYINNILQQADIDTDGDTIILRREINPAGRSRSFVNDTPAPLSLLREIAIYLVDIHSQHQNLLLADPAYQLSVIDTLLPDDNVKREYAEAYERYVAALKKYRAARRATETSKAEEEYMRFQLGKLEDLNPQQGEQEELEAERTVLSNVSSIKEQLGRLIYLFDAGETNIVGLLRSALSDLQGIDALPALNGIGERLEALRIEAVDIAETLAQADGNVEADPRRLEMIEERLADIYELERIHSVDTVEQLIVIKDELSERLDAIDSSDERVRQYATRAKAAKKQAVDVAARLTQARRLVAEKFASQLVENAIPLGMKNLRAEVQFTTADLSATGADHIDMMFAFNKNQPLMPVKDTASGGEISRLMLVIKAIIANHMQLPTLIFDEVDTGVSGDVASRMGALMKDISSHIQVIAITHLPPVAAKGDSHFKVYKEDSDTATNTRVRQLSAAERVDELALMLSGDATNDAARSTAASMLAQ